MIKVIQSLCFEVTRRCNVHCKHCMRGDAENIDIEKSYIDKILSEEDLIIINLTLSGGEPTLSPDLIIYILNKIVTERKIILSIQMTTNGVIYDERILAAFEKYRRYANQYLSGFTKHFSIEEIATIRFSDDQYHTSPISPEYYLCQSRYPEILFTRTGNIDILDDQLILTGRAKDYMFGRYFDYKLPKLIIQSNEFGHLFSNSFYLTATGYITTEGDGEYQDMDKINLGRVEEFTFAGLIDSPPKIKKKAV